MLLGVVCPEPITVDGADVTLSDNSYQHVVTYSCQYGYKLTGGNLTRTCLADRTWDGVLPVCTGKGTF